MRSAHSQWMPFNKPTPATPAPPWAWPTWPWHCGAVTSSTTPSTRNGLTVTASSSTTPSTRNGRSEEHTSELQSHSDLVCRLLLEKKKLTDYHHGHNELFCSTQTLKKISSGNRSRLRFRLRWGGWDYSSISSTNPGRTRSKQYNTF